MPDYPAQFYWRRDGRGRFHWHFLCDAVPIEVDKHPNWGAANRPPPDREPCPRCARRDDHVTVVRPAR